MNIVMLGVGGIGGYYAARLIDAGHKLSLVARGDHLSALQNSGLEVQHSGWHFQQSVNAYEWDSLVKNYNASDFDIICIAVKAQATHSFAPKLADWFSASDQSPAIISLQNGVDSEVILSEHVGADHIIGALCVGIGAHITAPGKITSVGPGRIVMGLWPNQYANSIGPAKNIINTLNETFIQSSIPSEMSNNIQQELWRKLVINNGVNPLSALTQLDTRSMTHHPEYQNIVLGLMQETVMAATADGVHLDQSVAAEMLEFMQQFDAIKTSMLVDKEKGRELELEAISGCVLDRMKKLKRDAPYTRTVYTLLKNLVN